MRCGSRKDEKHLLGKSVRISESIGNACLTGRGFRRGGSLAEGMPSHPVNCTVMTLGVMLLFIQLAPLSLLTSENRG